jgi:hypothetical protein
MSGGHAQALRGRIEALDREAQRREDYLAITRLQRAYGYYLDKGYWREAADLFAEDATFEQGVDGVYVGRERIFEVIVRLGGGNIGPGLPFGQLNERLQLQSVITLADDGLSAQARWHELAMYGQYGKHAHWGDGVYENRYRKEDGVWKIAALRFYPQFVAPYEGGWATLKPVEGDWRSPQLADFPPDRPPTATYRPFPDVYVPPFHYEHPVTGARPKKSTPAAPSGNADPLEAHLSDIELRLARLASHEAVERLQRAYGYYVDKGLWREAADLFTDDGTWEWGQSGVYKGRERIRAALALSGPEGLAPGLLNNHYICQPIVTVAPDNRTAKARWRADMQFQRDGKASWGEGTFENTYVNDDGVWKIASLHFYVTVLWEYDKGWVFGNIPMEGPSTTLPPDSPPTEVYESLPGVYLPKYHYPNPVTGAQPEKPVLPDLPAADADGLVGRIKALSTRVERIEDLRACEKLQRAYGYYVDKAMWNEVSDLFGPQSTLEIGGRGVFVGKKRVLEYLGIGLGPTGPQPGQIINHQQFQGIVTVDPEGGKARGRWRAFVIGGSPWAAVNWGSALYENHYRKVNGVWLIDKLHAPFTMYTLYKDGWHKVTTPNTRPESFPPPPDLPPTVVYLTYPNYYCEPFHYPNPVTGKVAPPPHPAAGGLAPLQPLSGSKR